MTSFISNLDSRPGEGGVKGKYDIRITTCMKEKYSQFIQEKNLLHGTILCQTEKNFRFACCTSAKTEIKHVPVFGT
jgi:hypothetical protein